MQHLLAFSGSIAVGAVLLPVPAIADQVLNRSGNDVFVPEEMPNIFATYMMGTNLVRGELVSPSLRRIFLEEIGVGDTAPIPAAAYKQMRFYGQDVLPLEPDELLEVQMFHSNAGAQQLTCLVWLCDVPPAPIAPTDVHTVRISSTTAAVANAWSLLPITFDQSLPAGQYELVGARFRSTNLQAFRFAFRGGSWRPGYPGAALISDYIDDWQDPGYIGVLGTFRHNLPPQIEVLCNAADSSFAGEMMVRYIGP